jgi:acetate kinase
MILSVNAGSSSLKISLYILSRPFDPDATPVIPLYTSSISNISSPPSKFSFCSQSSSPSCKIENILLENVNDHASAFTYFLHTLKHEASIDRRQISHVCHRVVHGGDGTDPVIISDDSYHHIETLSDLAPLCVLLIHTIPTLHFHRKQTDTMAPLSPSSMLVFQHSLMPSLSPTLTRPSIAPYRHI